MNLDEFMEERNRDIARRVDGGKVNVYFMHRTLTPGNVRQVWRDYEEIGVPRVAEEVRLTGAGYMGENVVWRAAEVNKIGPAAYDVICEDLP